MEGGDIHTEYSSNPNKPDFSAFYSRQDPQRKSGTHISIHVHFPFPPRPAKRRDAHTKERGETVANFKSLSPSFCLTGEEEEEGEIERKIL